VLALLATACSAGAPSGTGPTLAGSGSTFQQPFDEVVMAGFMAQQPAVAVTYGGGGSGKGQTDLQARLVQWAGTDSPVEEADVSSYQGKVLSFPTVAAPITVAYRLPGVEHLQLSPSTLAAIFAGKVDRWDDPALRKDNPRVDLPDTAVVVVHRSDGSGTTANFTSYLTKVAPAVWTRGADKTVPWPADQRAENGNAGVAQAVTSTDGAIGYVDYSDARAAGLVVAAIQNRARTFVRPSIASATAALEGVTLAPDLTYDPLDAAGAAAYPITAPTYVLVYQQQSDHTTGVALRGLLRFMLGEGQDLAASVDFARLPPSILAPARAQIDRLEIAPGQ